MSSTYPRQSHGPRTYEAVAAVAGMQLVEARAGGVDNGGCGPAADQSVKVLGVAQKDATPGGGAPRAFDTATQTLNAQLTPSEVAVYCNDFVPGVLYSTAAAYGARLVAGADGTVKPFVSGTHTADMIVGRCEEPAGVAQGARGLTRINV